MNRLRGKTALITGAARGIGRHFATAYVREGANVAIADIDVEGAARAAEELGSAAIAVELDVTSKASIDKGIDKTIEAFDGIDILVNNAGITKDNLFMRMKDAEWDDVLEVNMTASMLLCRNAMRAMMKARWGRIISISSIVGITGNPGQTNYAASKAGMIGFSKSLAAEVASRGITVNMIAPGFIETPMTDSLDEKQKDNLLAQVPVGRLGTADEVASAVLFLASSEASYLTGATLHVNGGMAML